MIFFSRTAVNFSKLEQVEKPQVPDHRHSKWQSNENSASALFKRGMAAHHRLAC